MTKNYKEIGPIFNNIKKLSEEDTFKFNCRACGKCCENRNNESSILLFPIDIFNISKALNLNPFDFLKEYTTSNIGQNSGLPVYYLKSRPLYNKKGSICSLAIPKKGKYICSVHKFKPGACGLFPLGRVQSTNKEGPSFEYFEQLDAKCMGSKESKEWTIDEWVPRREEGEQALISFGNNYEDLLKIVNLTNVYESRRLSNTVKNLLATMSAKLLYEMYDANKEFIPQFELNYEKIKHLSTCFVSQFQEQDSSIKGSNVKLMDKDFAMQEIILFLHEI